MIIWKENPKGVFTLIKDTKTEIEKNENFNKFIEALKKYSSIWKYSK